MEGRGHDIFASTWSTRELVQNNKKMGGGCPKWTMHPLNKVPLPNNVGVPCFFFGDLTKYPSLRGGKEQWSKRKIKPPKNARSGGKGCSKIGDSQSGGQCLKRGSLKDGDNKLGRKWSKFRNRAFGRPLAVKAERVWLRSFATRTPRSSPSSKFNDPVSGEQKHRATEKQRENTDSVHRGSSIHTPVKFINIQIYYQERNKKCIKNAHREVSNIVETKFAKFVRSF